MRCETYKWDARDDREFPAKLRELRLEARTEEEAESIANLYKMLKHNVLARMIPQWRALRAMHRSSIKN